MFCGGRQRESANPTQPSSTKVHENLKRIAINVLKYGVSLAILAYLFWKASGDESFDALRNQSKNWLLLSGALVLCMTAITLTIVRWFLLVRALKLPFTLPEALRLGYIGFLFTFLTLGVVGGDLVKAIFLARRQHGRRTEAVATVVIDRIIGLYALFIVAAIAIFFVDFTSIPVRNPQELAAVRTLCWISVGAAIAGTILLVIIALPSFGNTPLSEAAFRIPKIGNGIERVVTAIKMYRGKPRFMAGIGLMSLLIHCCFACSVFLIAAGLPGDAPSFGKHFVIVPLAMVANTLPLPGGMGAFEYALDFLYRGMSAANVAERQGFVIALGYRIATLFVAMVGVFFYLSRRQEVDELIEEARRVEQEGDKPREIDVTLAASPSKR